MRSIRLVPLAFVLGLAAACGGNSDSDGKVDDAAISLEELPAEYAKAICTVYTNCAGDLFALFRPGEDCIKNTTVQLEEELAGLQARVDSGRVVYDASKLQACLDEVTSRDCSFLSERAPESCKAALAGTVAEGDDCQLDEECEGEQYCKIGDACPGTCTLLEQAGGPCTGNSDCVSGLNCGETGRCVAPAAADKACRGGEPDCVGGYICLGNDEAANQPGTCQKIATVFGGKTGDTCTLESGLCASGFACEITMVTPVGGSCVPKVGSGDACRAAFPDPCPDDEYCKLGVDPLDPNEGVCTSKPEPGEACGKGLSPEPSVCAPYARCDDGVCREIAHLGEKCTVNATCYSDHCVNGACVAANSCN